MIRLHPVFFRFVNIEDSKASGRYDRAIVLFADVLWPDLIILAKV